ncbi:hypothetical protein L7F22_005648 [Adiantum nelumboides]|nr:hypothetical protein [Adiantum nelumboides]
MHKPDAKAAVAFLNIYMVVFGVSWGPVPWAMPSELFPSSLRAKGVAWAVMSNWFFNFIIGLIVPPLIQATATALSSSLPDLPFSPASLPSFLSLKQWARRSSSSTSSSTIRLARLTRQAGPHQRPFGGRASHRFPQ